MRRVRRRKEDTARKKDKRKGWGERRESKAEAFTSS